MMVLDTKSPKIVIPREISISNIENLKSLHPIIFKILEPKSKNVNHMVVLEENLGYPPTSLKKYERIKVHIDSSSIR